MLNVSFVGKRNECFTKILYRRYNIQIPINYPVNSGLYETSIQKENEIILKEIADTLRLHKKDTPNCVIDIHNTKI